MPFHMMCLKTKTNLLGVSLNGDIKEQIDLSTYIGHSYYLIKNFRLT